MGEDWIQQAADQQLKQERERANQDSASQAAQVAFDAAAAPYFAAVQSELRRLAAAYNAAIGRNDLIIPITPDRPDTFEIQRGNFLDGHCRVSLYTYGRQLISEYSYKDNAGSGHQGSRKYDLTHGPDGIRANQPLDGSPAAVANAILREWIGHFPNRAPESATKA